MSQEPSSSNFPRRQRDLGRLVAKLLCALFAFLGALPLGAGFIARSEAAQRWASAETSRELKRLLGLEATYQVRISLLPLQLALLNVEVAGNDGLGPAVRAERAAITPRIFSLIAGRLDIGDIELEGANNRLVFERGEIQNLDLKLPGRSDSDVDQTPFSSLAITDASFDLSVDGVKVSTGTVDLDVYADKQQGFEVALRAGETVVVYPPGYFANGQSWPPKSPDSKGPPTLASWDADVICQLDARLRLGPSEILVRRLSLIGSVDIDPSPGGAPGCKAEKDPGDIPGRVALSLSQFRLAPGTESRPLFARGSFTLRAPVDLGNRFEAGSYRGWVGLTGELRYDGSTILPEFRGKLKTNALWLDEVRLLESAEGQVELSSDRVTVPRLDVRYGGGTVTIHDIAVAPFEDNVPLSTRRVDISKVGFPAMMRDIDITPNTIVRWTLDKVSLGNFKGQLLPPKLDGDLHAETANFQITDKAYHAPGRRQMFAVKPRGLLVGRFGVREQGIEFNNMLVRFGKSQVKTTVHIGFDNSIDMVIPESRIDLEDISPIVTVPMTGKANLTAKMNGQMGDPLLTGTLSVDDWVFGGFPIGNLERTNLTFRPLWVEATGGRLVKGTSRFNLPTAKVDFGTAASIVASAQVTTGSANLTDFLRMWRFENDPLWRELRGKSKTRARVRYVLGGPGDPCQGGRLRVNGSADIQRLRLFDELYDSARSSFDFLWSDIEAGYHGMSLKLPGFQLRKGSGSVLGTVEISPGAKIQGNVVATAIPLSKLDGAGELGKFLSGDVSAIGQISGSLDALKADFQTRISPVIMGRSRLEPSQLHVLLKPEPSRVKFTDKRSGCERRVPQANTSTADVKLGEFHIAGHLFGKQVQLDEFSVSRQKNKVAKGGILLKGLALGPLLELRPEVALSKQRPKGQLSGRIDLEHLPLDNMGAAVAEAELEDLWLNFRDYRFRVLPAKGITLKQRTLETPRLTLSAATPAGHTTTFDAGGKINRLGPAPELDLELNLRPVELATWAAVIPRAERVRGSLRGKVHLSGPLSRLRQRGGFSLKDGELSLRGRDLSFDDVNVEVAMENNSLRVMRATANFNGGKLSARGSAPLRGVQLGRYRGLIQARNVNIPTSPGVKLRVDAELDTEWRPTKPGEEAILPKIGGNVSIRAFEYTRAVSMNADISDLAKRGNRTEFESYDPTKDAFELDMIVTSQEPLRLSNNLIGASLAVEKPGLRLTGTNQRFGLQGRLKVIPGGHIRLRRNDFEVESGEIRFDDATQIVPRVDVTAVTEYRRYSSSAATADPTIAGAPGGAAASGDWRISMRAHGDAENLKLDLTSQPKLSQDDIFLLLTVGLTRAELDQAQSASLGESVALEALGSLTGADTALTDALPVIDEFRFGSSYSSRTGRTEPTVTIGKRLTERIRAFVTSGLSESREVRSNLEWRLNRKLSVEGSYDNVNDISATGLGNLGADVRWRLEFE